MEVSLAIQIHQAANILILISGIISTILSVYFFHKYIELKKRYFIQIGVSLLLCGISFCMRYGAMANIKFYQSPLLIIMHNWIQGLTVLAFHNLICDLLLLLCVASIWWTPSKVRIFKWISMMGLMLGFVGQLFARVLFIPGDGSLLDRYHRTMSPIAAVLLQLIALYLGIYMTLLMKGLCNIKDYKTKLNFDLFYNQSIKLLILFIIANICVGVCFLIGVRLEGGDGSAGSYLRLSLYSASLFWLLIQLISLAFLFEAIKKMKFGADVQRKTTATT
ncbi:hypothetical protein BC833DRAFT_133251 [Globomyces pollinis-pini]|nr:hypothetical protein BC833DRAFT_133251 [Globomyces pollinis-pini]